MIKNFLIEAFWVLGKTFELKAFRVEFPAIIFDGPVVGMVAPESMKPKLPEATAKVP